MPSKPLTSSLDQGWFLWPVLLVLMAAVLVPTACVLWFMNAAMRNERLAVQQRLGEVYRRHLLDIRDELDGYWSQKVRLPPSAGTAAKTFAELVRSGAADSLVLYDETGRVSYPLQCAPPSPAEQNKSPQWLQGEKLE